jgi:hypothetical protein
MMTMMARILGSSCWKGRPIIGCLSKRVWIPIRRAVDCVPHYLSFIIWYLKYIRYIFLYLYLDQLSQSTYMVFLELSITDFCEAVRKDKMNIRSYRKYSNLLPLVKAALKT